MERFQKSGTTIPVNQGCFTQIPERVTTEELCNWWSHLFDSAPTGSARGAEPPPNKSAHDFNMETEEDRYMMDTGYSSDERGRD